jgi:hypothetical protein
VRRVLRLTWAVAAMAGACPAATYYLAIAGLGGEPDYEARFAGLAVDLQKSLSASAGEKQVETLSGASATKAAIRAALDRMASAAKPADEFVLLLIGHGTFDGVSYKFNVPGPDLTAVELRSWLDKIPGRQLVVNMTSCSGAALADLRRENRVVITATRSGTERMATVFSRYFAEALRDPSSDVDKNDVISALEAFRFADQRTTRFFETQKRVATEHALLEDTGKADGVRNPSPDNGQGLLAARFAVVRTGSAQAAYRDPEKQKLLARKEELEQQIDELKYQKAAMAIDDYKSKLSTLLLDLARTQEQLDK